MSDRSSTAPPRRGPATDGVRFETFGCRLNAYETEAMRALAGRAAAATDGGVDDVVVLNTCAVTAEAVRQAEQRIRKIRRERPDARIVVTGCAAQIDPGRFAAMTAVDLVLGNQEKLAPQSWADLASSGSATTEDPPAPVADLAGAAAAAAKVQVADIFAVRETAPQLIDGFGRARAYVQVQNGCDHRCTFCVIPYGRGASRSVPAGVVVDQAKRLVAAGHRELVLTGVDITSWGADLPPLGGRRPRLGDLVQRLLRLVPDLPRLRLSSIDNAEADPALWEAAANEPRFAPHLHLSLQSGSDLILKRMKRRHLRADAIAFCARMREARPEMAFGADLIAGFPTETDSDFEASLDLLSACRLAYVHVFPYSPRDGTPAARMPQTPRAVVKARAKRLRAAAAARLQAHYAAQVGRELELLMEAPTRGRAPDFSEAETDGPQAVGSVIRARVAAAGPARLSAVAL